MLKYLTLFSVALTLTIQSDLQIVNLPSGTPGPAPCAITCGGVASWNTTGSFDGKGWRDSGEVRGRAFMQVSMRQCNFASLPVITASVRTGSDEMCPPLVQRHVFNNQFTVYTYEKIDADEMKEYKCDVHWTALGFIC